MNSSPEYLTSEAAYGQYLAALLAGERRVCRAHFEAWLEAGLELRRLYEELVQRSLYDVGRLWEQGRVSVATEHLATAITESLLSLAYPRLFSQPQTGKAAVVACAAQEYHQVGAKLVADTFELHGWRGHFLGANTPTAELLGLIMEQRPQVVAFSLTVHFNLAALLQMAGAVRAAFPEMPLLAGGQGFRCGGRTQAEQVRGLRCLGSLGELEQWLQDRGTHAH